MYLTCLDNTLILHLCLLSSKPYKDGFNKFPLFDDGKPNYHILVIREQQSVSAKIQVTHKQAIAKNKFSRKSTHPRYNENTHGHSNLPPSGIIEKRLIRTNK